MAVAFLIEDEQAEYAVVSFGAFPGTSSKLYTINKATGVATLVGTVSGGYVLPGIRFGAAAGVTVTQSGGSTNVTVGGATDNYTVVLNSAPAANVTIITHIPHP